jgi:nucleoside-diphosphate-sugar epimerase
MKISVVGGAGFIGTNLSKRLSSHSLFNIDKSSLNIEGQEMLVADVRDYNSLQDTIPTSDWLIVLAAEHRDDVSPSALYYDVNVEGIKNVLKVADERKIKQVLFTSSVAVYGLNKENPNEEHPVDPFNHYGKSKYEAEEILRSWYEKDPQNKTLVIIRPTVVFGPKNRGNVYNLLRQIASGKFLMIGTGKNKKSMTYVENMTGFIEFCLEKGLSGYHLFNYADKPDLTTKELVDHAYKSLEGKKTSIRIPYFVGYSAGLVFDLLAKVLNKKLPISSVRVQKFCATTQFDASKAIALGYVPKYSLEDGIDITIRSIRDSESV